MSAMQQASDTAAASPPRCSLFPPPRGAAGVERVPIAATVASVYPSCRASCRVSRQHSSATSNAVAHIRRLNDSFIHYFPALSSHLSLLLSPPLSPHSFSLSFHSLCLLFCVFSVALYELAYIVHVLWTAAHLARTKPERGRCRGAGEGRSKGGTRREATYPRRWGVAGGMRRGFGALINEPASARESCRVS